MSEPRIIFDFLGQHFDLSLDESVQLRMIIGTEREKLRVRCPTCRCRIMPGSECGCCAGTSDGVEPIL